MEEALNWINQYGLVAVSLLILSCGIGAPISQDVIVLLAGFLVGQKAFNFLDTLIVCFASILAADMIIYHIGRLHKFVPFVHKVITPKRRAWIEVFFKKFGSESILLVAFLPGLRTPTFITAGIVKMPLWKYIIWDFIGMGIVTVLELYLASRIKVPLDVLEKTYHKIAIVVLVIFLSILLISVVKYFHKKINKKG